MRIIAYTYEADYHCIKCAGKRFPAGPLDELDGQNIPYCAKDREGNDIHPVFSTDELPCDFEPEDGGYSPVVCGDCRTIIAEGSLETLKYDTHYCRNGPR